MHRRLAKPTSQDEISLSPCSWLPCVGALRRSATTADQPSDAAADRDPLLADCKASKDSAAALQERINTLEAAAADAPALLRQLEEADGQRQAAGRQLDDARHEAEDARRSAASLERDLTEARERAASLEKAAQAARNFQEAAEGERGALAAGLQAKDERLAELASTVATLEQAQTAARAEAADAERRRHEAETAVSGVNGEGGESWPCYQLHLGNVCCKLDMRLIKLRLLLRHRLAMHVVVASQVTGPVPPASGGL